MSDLVGMANAIKKVLTEVELKDAIGKLKPSDIMKVVKTDGHKFILDIQSSVGGNFIVKNQADGKEYTFGVNDFRNGILTVYEYKGGGISYRGEPTEHEIKYFVMGTPNGEPMFIDPSGEGEVENDDGESDGESDGEKELPTDPHEAEDLESDKNEFTQVLNAAKNDDHIHISVNIPEEGTTRNQGQYSSENDLVLVVRKAHADSLEVNLAHIEGGNSKELSDQLNNKNIVINKSESIYSENGQLKLKLAIKSGGKGSIYTVPHIVYLGINNYQKKVGLDGEDRGSKTLSRDALLKMIAKDPDVKNMWLKTPGIKKTIAGASPTGLYQIAKLLKKRKLKDAYLKVGTHVEFKVLDRMVSGFGRYTRLTLDPDSDRGYSGRILRDKVIIQGNNVNQVHWEIELMDEVKENIYEVKYMFCTKADKCTYKGKGMIEIIDILNKKR